MASKEEINEALDTLEKRMTKKINSGYSLLVKDVNDCIEKILNSTLQNVGNLEVSMKKYILCMKEYLMEEESEDNQEEILLNFKTANKQQNRFLTVDSLAPDVELKTETMSMNEEKIYILDDNPEVSTDIDIKQNTEFITTEIPTRNIVNASTKSQKSSFPIIERADTFKCTQCTYSSLKNGYLLRHIEKVHPNTEKWSCEHCEYSTNQKEDMDDHINEAHLFSTEFSCKYCDQVLSSAGDLADHKHTKHRNLKKDVSKNNKRAKIA